MMGRLAHRRLNHHTGKLAKLMQLTKLAERGMTDIEAMVQRYYGGPPLAEVAP
jgi:hypothetical protein